MLLNPYRFGAAGGSSFYDLVMAQSPVNYWRNGEASGTVMVDEITTDGTYYGGVNLGNAALYPGPGADTSAGGNFSTAGILGQSTALPSSLSSMTLLSIIRPTNLSGFHLVGVQRDEGGAFGARFYQWRSFNGDLEFVKIAGGVVTVSQPSALLVNNTYLLAFEVDASGNYAMYKNGVSVKTGNIGGTNYGGAGDPWSIGAASGPSTNLVGTTCENAVFDKVLGPTVHAALFAATGL